MALLLPTEYNRAYFDGDLEESLGGVAHPAGYSSYQKWYRHEGANSRGEYWEDYASGWINNLAISGKKVLDVGCAKGFLVKSLRDRGVDAWGIDISQYAINEADTSVQPYLTVGDARVLLPTYQRNAYDVIISIGLIECMTDQEAIVFISECKRVGRTVIVVTYEQCPVDYYNVKTVAEWAAILPNRVRIVSKETRQEVTS